MKLEYEAWKARVQAHVKLSNKTFTALRFVSGAPVRANYVVLFPAVPDDLDDARYLASQSRDSTAEYTYDTRIVATTAEGVLDLADAVMEQAIGHSLVVTGRMCEPITLVPGVEEGRVEYDRTADLYFLDFSVRFRSRRG